MMMAVLLTLKKYKNSTSSPNVNETDRLSVSVYVYKGVTKKSFFPNSHYTRNIFFYLWGKTGKKLVSFSLVSTLLSFVQTAWNF